MAKKNNTGVKNQAKMAQKQTVDLPEILTIDQLSEMSDDDIFNHLRTLRSGLEQARSSQGDVQTWEVDLCYVDRELQIRKLRRDLHQSYLASIGELKVQSEDYLPSADLDNSAFTALV